MEAEYFETPMDTFLATTTIKPRDCHPYMRTREEKKKRREALLEAAKEDVRLSV